MSKFIEWSDELSVSIEEIDRQHKRLVDMVNRMHEAIQEHHGSEVVNGILDELAEYTTIHFAVEEGLMNILAYPDYEEHAEQHRDLIEKIVDLQEKVKSGKHSVGFELMHFLKVWLTKHILEEDMQYSGFFLAAGVRESSAKKSWFSRFWSSLTS